MSDADRESPLAAISDHVLVLGELALTAELFAMYMRAEHPEKSMENEAGAAALIATILHERVHAIEAEIERARGFKVGGAEAGRCVPR